MGYSDFSRLKPCKCIKCDYEGNDVEFKTLDFKKASINAIMTETIIVCPKCGFKDTMEYLSDNSYNDFDEDLDE